MQFGIKKAVLDAVAENALDESKVLPKSLPDDEHVVDDSVKLSKLIDDDFPFDESQLAAINGMASQRYACLTGAAGTGKTTTTKKLVDSLLSQGLIDSVDMSTYFGEGYNPEDDSDDYEIPQQKVPAVCLVGFTGRSTQMIKKNFPRDWHGNIMTIHRMLAYMPEWYDTMDENGNFTKKMRFVPTYTADFKLPWDIIIIDEAGMVGLDLWNNIWAAAKAGCRIYMIGDINQLPPVHGRSIFGFAMSRWPAWELTHIHRQQGVNNPIVDNAWRVLNGQMPTAEGAFQMIPFKGNADYASKQIRATAPKLREMGIYDPIRDTIITPINGEDGARGYALGQIPLNREFALIFNPSNVSPRYIIDAGRERKYFAVGDKVMATRNDHEVGITNGMTGIIIGIKENGGYAGDSRMYGRLEDVESYMRELEQREDGPEDFSIDDLNVMFEKSFEESKNKKEKTDRGPASHVVTVRFGNEEHGFEYSFSTLAEVMSLMTAYVVTCHKMQGGEAPTILILAHDAHKAMMYREWLYTAITRASQKCILFYSPDALRAALNKQKIKGSTLREKVQMFIRLSEDTGMFGPAVTVNLPDAESMEGMDTDKSTALALTSGSTGVAPIRHDAPASPAMINAFQNMINKASLPKQEPKQEPKPEPTVIRETVVVERVFVVKESEPQPTPPADVDGGDLTPQPRDWNQVIREEIVAPTGSLYLPAPAKLVSQHGAVQMLHRIQDEQAKLLLPAPLAPAPAPTPTAAPKFQFIIRTKGA